MEPLLATSATRRRFLTGISQSVGLLAAASLLADDTPNASASGAPHFLPRAKRVIYLFQSGGPSQLDLFDEKPELERLQGTDLPDSIRRGQRLTGMTATQDRFPIAASKFRFSTHGQSGTRLSELLPYTARIVDDICLLKTLKTEAINHDPAVTFLQTGAQLAGRPSIGSWLSYGLGSLNANLPAYMALVSGTGDQPLYDRLWGSGFLPSQFQGTKLSSVGDPIPFLSNPPGIDRKLRSEIVSEVNALNSLRLESAGDPEIVTRIAQYEMAFRMQSAVPELVDVSSEPDHIFEMYGAESRQRGTFANNCLLARRLIEGGVRFVQLFHRGWDQHRRLPREITKQSQLTDQPSAALVQDLKQRGLLDDTIVIWGGEFGRTVYCQGALSPGDYGRDHHPRCFTVWMAGGGFRPGMSYGRTDDFSYNTEEGPVHVHDFHATLLHLLGIDHKRLTYRFQGRDFRLTDVQGNVVDQLLA
ncbi:MAG TPA: DUF1501 domain-containing protein [Caulifigura sp.]|nr:DUF1501 domain-containing protein [Caulifigura sp.]